MGFFYNKAKMLADLFTLHKDDQMGNMAENEGRRAGAALSDNQHARCEGDEGSSQSNSSPKALDLREFFTKSASDGAAVEIYRTSKHLNEPPGEQAGRISCEVLREEADVSSNSIKFCNSTGLVKDDSLNADLQRSYNNDGLNFLDLLAETSSTEDMEASKLDDKSIHFKGLKERLKVPFHSSNEDQRQRQKTRAARTESEENRVLVGFLRSYVTENQVLECFNSCGEILKIEFPYAQGPLFKAAYIDFKTREGFEKALQRSGLLVHSGAVIVESATSMEKKTVKIPIPALLGDPDIPAALVKNPTRTIKIEQLTHEISLRHIEEALAFCKSNISGYSLGASHSVAYVEFETEIGKERALAKQSINVSGRNLVMLRIDCPKTTVVRISSMDYLKLKDIISICKSLGDISLSVKRCPNVVDVYFTVAEWPNMLKILNRLNGCIVEGRRLQAEPAPIFPPEVLLALWNHPEERKHLKATAQVLLHKLLENMVDASELPSIEDNFFSRI